MIEWPHDLGPLIFGFLCGVAFMAIVVENALDRHHRRHDPDGELDL